MSNTAVISYESHASTSYQEGAITITKPTGLAVNDLLVVCLFFANTNTVDTPSGWSVARNNAGDFSDDTDGAIFYKLADSGDVAASNFSFDVADGTGSIGGTLVRFSGVNQTTQIEQVDQAGDTGTGTTRSHTTSVTPTTSGSILFVFAHYNINETMASYSSTGSPTWTELTQLTGANDEQLAVVYAPYPSTTEVTNFSFDVGSAGAGADSQIVMFVIRTVVDSDTTPTFVSSTQAAFAPTGSAGATTSVGFTSSTQSAFAPLAESFDSAIIANEAKNDAAFSNQSKNSVSPSNQSKNSASWSNQAKSVI